MFNRTDDKITSSQAAVFLTNTLLGAGILTLPRNVTQAMQTPDAWITILLGGAAMLGIVLLMVKLCLQFPGQTVFQYAGKIIGKFPGKLVGMLLILYFIVVAGFEIRTLAEVTTFFLLEGTPSEAIVLPFIWAGVYLVLGGINSIARVFQIVLPISILVLLVSFGVSLRLFDINHLRPVLGSGFLPILRGMKTAILIYAGCEVILTLTAFLQEPKQAVKAMLGGIAIPIFLYLLTVVFVIGCLSVDSVVTSTWPTIDLVRSFEITGFFIERLEFPFMVIWLMQMFCNFSSFFFQASLGISQIFNVRLKPVIFLLAPAIFIATMLPRSLQDVFTLGDSIGYIGLGMFFLLPLLLTLIWMIRKKGTKGHA
ncbi:GerAB/ArcD/ProY family transporter [Paenibacillus apis]|uniref:Germination protein BB n=1 Tax=Paenibacillus apis TaxID=1792174 RepID=A0A920CPG9_9BACL|nr:GerAB/ArcD/ProY family transporter [Paenibacillus apis]GIO44217.1 germination protein BB [Paenibacillus apis]